MDSVLFTRRASVAENVLVQELQGETVFLNLDTESYLGLDEVGTSMWKAIVKCSSLQEAYDRLLDEYDVEPERLRNDLSNLVEELVKHGLVLRWARDRRRGYRRLALDERRLAIEAALVLPITTLSLGLFGFARGRSLVAAAADLLRRRTPLNPQWARRDVPVVTVESVARRTAAVVRAVAQRHPCRSNCLHRSLTLWCLLRGEGIDSQLRVGVRTGGGEFEAHAWVEYDGSVIDDHDDVQLRFLPFAEALVSQRAVTS